MATLATVFYVAAAAHRAAAARDARVGRPAGHRRRRVHRVARLHGAAVEVRLSRAGRDRRGDRLRTADAARARTSSRPRGALAWEPFVASIPIALLVALILYVNEIPDRRGDAHAGKRTLPVRFSRSAVIGGYNVAVAAAYAAVVVGVVAGPAADPGAADAADDPAGPARVDRARPELRQPVRADGLHGRQRPAASRGGRPAARGVRDRDRRDDIRSWSRSVPAAEAPAVERWRRRAPGKRPR